MQIIFECLQGKIYIEWSFIPALNLMITRNLCGNFGFIKTSFNFNFQVKGFTSSG